MIGIAACQPMRIVYSDGYVPGDMIEQDRAELADEINAAETEFRRALGARVNRGRVMKRVDRRSVVGALVTAGATVGVTDLANALPPELRLQGKTTKRILKLAMRSGSAVWRRKIAWPARK